MVPDDDIDGCVRGTVVPEGRSVPYGMQPPALDGLA
jgi:hypothetical protein